MNSRPRSRPWLRVVGSAALTFAALAGFGFAVLRMLDGAEASARLWQLSPGWLAAALAAWSLSVVVQALRLRALVPVRPSPPVGGFVAVVLGSNAVHLALPGPIAELGAAWALRQRYGVPMPSALAAALLARVLALAIFGVLTLAMWPLVAARVPATLSAALGPLAVATGLAGLGLLGVLARPVQVVVLAARLAERLGAVPMLARHSARIGDRLRWWARCFAAVGGVPIGRWVQAAGLSVVNLGVLTASALLTLRALGIEADPLGTTFMQALTAVASVAGLFVPGGLGAVEVLVVLLFPLYAVGSTADAVVAALLLRAVHLTTLVFGIPAMSWLVATLPEDARARTLAMSDALKSDLDRVESR